jgi:uncharacterized protein
MKKILLILAILVILVLGAYFIQKYSKGSILPIGAGIPTVTIGNYSFKVTVATSEKDQEIGLSETNSLAINQGMIFLFQAPGYYPFWMKNMKFPIDIIYIDSDTIVTIINDAKAPKNSSESLTIYTPTQPADKVLEIQSGLSGKYHFQNGDKVKYENFGN